MSVCVRAGQTGISRLQPLVSRSVITEGVVPGPGTLRVARFIERLGIVSLPAVEVALDLDQRVVRRHVAKLEAAGWLARMPWVWGQGSVAWLTATGVERQASAAPGQVPACADHDRPRRTRGMVSGTRGTPGQNVEVRARTCARRRALGGANALRARLHDPTPRPRCLAEAVRPTVGRGRRERQAPRGSPETDARRMARRSPQRTLRRRALRCASASVATWISRLAKRVWLTAPDFSVIVQTTAEEIATLARADAEGEGRVANEPESTVGAARTRNGKVSIAPVDVRVSATSVPVPRAEEERPAPRPETLEEAAERAALSRDFRNP